MDMLENFKKKFVVSMILTIPILILSPMIQEIFGYSLKFYGDKELLFIFSSAIFFYGGSVFLVELYKEVKNKKIGMMTLVGLAISVAYLYSTSTLFLLQGKTFFWELATLIDIMLLGHIIEMKATMSASSSIEGIIKLLPSKAHLISKDGSIKNIEISKLKTGDRILIKPGEKIPADGIIKQGETEIDESLLTGESKPKAKNENDHVIGGSINVDGSLEIVIKEIGENTYISQVIKLVKESLKNKSKTQTLADKFAKFLTFSSISIGILSLTAWLLLDKDFAFAIERMVTVMIITCPHALGIAIPLVASITTTFAAQNGLLIKNRTAFEKARKTTTVLFDKTGTLTNGKFSITKIVSLSNWDEEKIIQYAASLENHSEHSIGKSIVEESKKRKIKLFEIKNFKTIPGKGAEGLVENNKIFVGNKKLLNEMNIKMKKSDLKIETQTFIFVSTNQDVKGVIIMEDQIRSEAITACKKLLKMGIKIAMISGDNEKTVKKIAQKLKIKTLFAQTLPHQKAEKVKILQKQGEFVAMVGDGINDAPALAQADIGIAIGSGTEIAAQTADIILVKNNPLNVVDAINLAKVSYRKMIENLLWASGYNVIAIPIAAGLLYNFGINLTPAIGAIAMSASDVIVAINSKLMKFKKQKINKKNIFIKKTTSCH